MVLVSVPGGVALDVLIQDIRSSQDDLDEDVRKAIESLQKSSELVARLEKGVKERTEKIAQLKEDYDHYKTLAEVESKKAEAFVKQLAATVGEGKGRERWVAFGINLVAGAVIFVAGLLLADPLKELVAGLLRTGGG